MARVQKDTVSYFPHDANACTSDTLTVLQSRFGNDGYAFWFKLLEKLALTDGHSLDVSNPTKWHLLLAKMGVNELTGVEIMKLLVEMQAIDKDLWDSKVIWCQKLVENISDVYKNRRREIPQKPLNTNHNGITTDKKAITTGGSTQSKVKENKVDNNKYIDLFNIWNELKITSHRNLTNDMKRAIDNTLKDYSPEEIEQAIRNYALILKGNEYLWTYKYTLVDFLSRRNSNNIERFLDLEVAKSNFKAKGGQSGTNKGNPTPDRTTDADRRRGLA